MSLPFDLHSAAVSDSHLPCHAHAVLRPCRSDSDFSRPRLSTARARHGHGMTCVNYHQLSIEGLWASCPLSASSGYHAEFHEGRYQSIPIPDAGGQCETKQRLSWTRKSLLFWCKDMSKKSSITGFAVSTNVDFGKLIIGID